MCSICIVVLVIFGVVCGSVVKIFVVSQLMVNAIETLFIQMFTFWAGKALEILGFLLQMVLKTVINTHTCTLTLFLDFMAVFYIWSNLCL